MYVFCRGPKSKGGRLFGDPLKAWILSQKGGWAINRHQAIIYGTQYMFDNKYIYIYFVLIHTHILMNNFLFLVILVYIVLNIHTFLPLGP